MKFLLFVLPAIIFNVNNAVAPKQSTSDALICAQSNYDGISFDDLNTQNLIEPSFNKFIVSNKTTHRCAINVVYLFVDTKCRDTLLVLKALQTAVPIKNCNTQNINCKDSSCGLSEISACCNGNYCNKAENIIINHAVFYPNSTLARTKNDSYYNRYSNNTCVTADPDSNKPCIIVNYKNKHFNSLPNAIQNIIDCNTKDTTDKNNNSSTPTKGTTDEDNNSSTPTKDTTDEDNNNSSNFNYLNPILVIISFFISKIY